MSSNEQHIMTALDPLLAELESYFGPELRQLSPRELAAVAFDASGLGIVTIHEYWRCIGSGNLKSYARSLVAQYQRDKRA